MGDQETTTTHTRRHASPGRRSRFGDVLRRLRRHSKLTQAELARRVGLQGHAFLSQVENGRLPLPAHWLIPLAEQFKVNPQRLAWIYVAMEVPDLYLAIGGREPPDLDPETLLRMLSQGRPDGNNKLADRPVPANVASMPSEIEMPDAPAVPERRIVRN